VINYRPPYHEGDLDTVKEQLSYYHKRQAFLDQTGLTEMRVLEQELTHMKRANEAYEKQYRNELERERKAQQRKDRRSR
jgi:hypothetical protein